jgi:hypothetical protein
VAFAKNAPRLVTGGQEHVMVAVLFKIAPADSGSALASILFGDLRFGQHLCRARLALQRHALA